MAEGATAAPLKPDPELMAESEKLFALDQQGNAAKENTHWSVNTRSTNGKYGQDITLIITYCTT